MIVNTVEGMVRVKGELNKEFVIMDHGEMRRILGIRVERDRKEGTLKISQEPYLDTILAQDANPVSTPLSTSVKLSIPLESSNKPSINIPYGQAIGVLMYTALGTRPDIAFAVQHLSQFSDTYGPEHWTAVKHVLHYLKGMGNDGITFKCGMGVELRLFVDANYANCTDALSIGGYMAIMGGG
jgi:hypothetical protein